MTNGLSWSLAAALLFLTALSARAQENLPTDLSHGDVLYGACNSPVVEMRYYCTVYIEGAADSFVFADSMYTYAGHLPHAFCLPSQVSYGELSDVLLRYMAGHPSERTYSSPMIMGRAFHLAFPCPEAGSH